MIVTMNVFLVAAVLAVGSAVDVPLNNHWNGGFQAKACIGITKELHSWTAHLRFDQAVDSLDIWTADAKKADGGKEYVLTNKAWNADEHVGDQLCLDFVAHTTGDITPKTTLEIEGMGGGVAPTSGSVTQGNGPTKPHQVATIPPIPHTGGGTARYAYGEALAKSILFYDAQRSGKLPANNPIPWRGDSALGDKGDNGEDLTGGWYDAGDHVKFSLPMSSTSTVLLWGYLQWKDAYATMKQTDMFFDMIKWPLDYYLKCWIPKSQTLYAQVGEGNDDHHFWGRAEDMKMARPAYKLTPSKPGSDVAGEIAASLAAGYLAFKQRDATYAAKLLSTSKEIYEFGKKNPGTYSSSIQDAGQFYSSSGYKDEMCEGAMWLYRATGDKSYLADAKGYHENAWAWALGWDDKKIACQLLLYEATRDTAYKTEVEGFFKGWLPGGSITYTPCGQAWRDQWGSNRYAGDAAFVALVAADAGIDTATYRKWAAQQMNYILGDNNYGISYQIGFGSKYPRSPHHRSASCPDRPAPCTEANLHSSGPSPQLLVGAIVGGPGNDDSYKDNREDYVHNEVACDYNSGFQSALAGLTHLVAKKELPDVGKPKCHGS
ncbi:endoglucanase E-4-like isoform X2 [Haliotis rubra]|uniref:endoglucanase E-4-like isoform X2 n=1 Tax=Haliotis rubra TaxID=36100 RepID=UPI001EE624E4|nr:endoglucanase E-4-like isoform X2 [Haliotis rubra]